ncbi:MAG: DNA-3-methyladenine glycosylase 2 [Firmicutes bacterium]|nr:DNA-3-methyladenine glycosylase 2 [[Eubacterium] siraeum]MCM1488625.1 DNA-3-methyladenine glycosylase 2 [Bacillota bacterium]
MKYEIKCSCLDLKQTLFCGQCFRFKDLGNGEFTGIVGNKLGKFVQREDGIEIECEKEDLPFWRDYFDLDLDYDSILKEFNKDKTLSSACKGRKIRVLRQPPFETLISFIISQNNNIKRITGIIDRLCESFGTKTDFGYAFPTEQELKDVSQEALAPLRAGFRAKYIVDAAEKINSGEVDLEKIKTLPDDEAREALKIIKGVGDKVADCVLLFGLHRLSAVPKDVWIKRINAYYYPNGYPDCIKGREGIAQQYLFDFARTDFKEMLEQTEKSGKKA